MINNEQIKPVNSSINKADGYIVFSSRKNNILNYPIISIWSVGRNHCSNFKRGIKDYTKRIARYCNINWKIIPACTFNEKNIINEIEEIKQKEGELILKRLEPDDYIIVLEEVGKQHDSKEFAQIIQERINEKCKKIVFIIGGAYGLSDVVLKRAHHQWSLTNLVLPHQLVRLVLVEQLFRAFTIINNEKYHHD